MIPEPDGTKRPLGVPVVRDRVCQQATKLILEPLFEADFLPCSFMSGKSWEKRRIIRYYLHRWPSQRSKKRVRQRIKELTDRRWVGVGLEVLIERLNHSYGDGRTTSAPVTRQVGSSRSTVTWRGG